MRSRRPWAALARLGQAHWFFGNLYEAVVDVPQLLLDARPNRAPRILGPGSPVRYYVPVAPVTLAATAATLHQSWRAGGDRRAVVTAAAGTVTATALTAYLVKAVNLRLLGSDEALSDDERRRLTKAWRRGNLARLLALAVAAGATDRAGRTADRPVAARPVRPGATSGR